MDGPVGVFAARRSRRGAGPFRRPRQLTFSIGVILGIFLGVLTNAVT